MNQIPWDFFARIARALSYASAPLGGSVNMPPQRHPIPGKPYVGTTPTQPGHSMKKNPQALHLDQNHHPDPRNPGTTMTTNLRRRTLARNRTSQNGRYDSFCSNGTNVFR